MPIMSQCTEMTLLLCLLFAFFANPALSGKRESDGVLYDNTALGIRPHYPNSEMLSVGYPGPAPDTMVQTWRYVAFSNDDLPKVHKVSCSTIYVPKENGNDCGEYTLKFEDGDDTREFCGEVAPFELLTKTSDITFTLRTGANFGAKVACTVQAVYIDQSGREITTTSTTTTPAPTRKAITFWDHQTEEIDSTEEGGAVGKKRTTCPCGWANKVKSRIVNGTVTAEHEFPFAAGLVYRESNWRFCGATIVTEWHALTAAHCTDKTDPRELGLLVGEHDVTDEITGPTEVIPIENIVNHQDYTPGIWSNDIALLILERKITFSQFVGPACLPTQQLDLQRKYIKIIGWGADVFKGAQSAVLKKVNVRVVPRDECHVIYSSVNPTHPKQICTYRTRRASCQGDSGGPVMWLDPETNRYTHVGIVSFGRICGDKSPSVHTDVGAYLDWIHHFIRVSKPGQTCTKA